MSDVIFIVRTRLRGATGIYLAETRNDAKHVQDNAPNPTQQKNYPI